MMHPMTAAGDRLHEKAAHPRRPILIQVSRILETPYSGQTSVASLEKANHSFAHMELKSFKQYIRGKSLNKLLHRARMISILTCTARLLRRTLESIATLCSVKA
jgi:hypothetical protein